MSKCWKCGRLTFPWERTANQFVKTHHPWPESNPPPGSFICGRCHSLVINQIARNGGQLYHLMRSPKDLVLILQTLSAITQDPLEDLLKDGISLEPGSLYKTNLIPLLKDLLKGTASKDDLKSWGRKHGGWGCGLEATTNLIVEKSMRILQYRPAWLANNKQWEAADCSVSITSPLLNRTENMCVLRIMAEWAIHGDYERGHLIVLSVSKGRFLWFNAVEKWSRSFH